MKRLFTFTALVILLSVTANSQVFFSEGFDNMVMPPSGWSIDQNADHWHLCIVNETNGVPPEAAFNWDPIEMVTSRLISPQTDLTSYSQVVFKFKHALRDFSGAAGNYTLAVQTRSGGGSWNTVWEIVDPAANIAAEEINVNISNSDVGQADFEICFMFSGNTVHIDGWYIDDILLYYANPQGINNPLSSVESIIDLYPNPATTFLNCRLPAEQAELSTFSFQFSIWIYDLLGEIEDVVEVPEGQDRVRIDIEHYAVGIYLVVIKNESTIVGRKKFVKK